MKTIRRRAASPLLKWEAAGPNQEYRVIVRNQDTGAREAIYSGFRTECRLPPHLRLTSDLLAFQVMNRPADDPDARFVRFRDYEPIARLGDDYQTPAADLLTAPVATGAEQYRLAVHGQNSDRPIVSLVRSDPRFLLPVGRLREGTFTYDLTPRLGGRWRGRQRFAITPAMIAAADARAMREVPAPAAKSASIKGEAAPHAPGRPDHLAPQATAQGPRLLVMANVTATPEVSPKADPRDIARRQWWSGDGSAALESVVLALEAERLRGFFFLDVLSGEALGEKPLSRLAGMLRDRGHGLGLMVNPEPWRSVSSALSEMSDVEAFRESARRFQKIVGEPAPAVSFGDGVLTLDMLAVARELEIRAVLADRDGQLGLPAWMRWRAAPFAAYDDLAVIPTGMILSTPAHDRDRVVRHELSANDALSAADAAAIVAGQARGGGDRLVVATVSPLDLLLRVMVRSPRRADEWNQTLSDTLPTWLEAGWERSPHGFPVLEGRNEIKAEMLAALVATLGRAGIPCADPKTVFSPGALRAWTENPEPYDRLVEHRRGPRRLRSSVIRRYDPSMLQALGREPA